MIRTLAMFVLAACAGCSAAPRLSSPTLPAAPSLDRPADFALAVSVYAADASPARPRSLRASRYLVEADGALRAGATTPGEVGERVFPPIARTLAPRELDQLWSLVRQTGLIESSDQAIVVDPASIAAFKTGETAALVWVAQGGRRTTYRVQLDRQSDTAVSTERLIDRLAEWSLVTATGR